MLFYSVTSVSALSISPGINNIDAIINEQVCVDITLTSDDDATLTASDKWTSEKSDKGYSSAYIYSSDEFSIDITYPSEITVDSDGEEVEVCLEGSLEGEYFGLMVFDSPPEGTTSVSVGSWLNVNIQEQTQEANQQTGSSNSNPSSSNTNTEDSIEIQVTEDEDIIENIQEGILEVKEEINLDGPIASLLTGEVTKQDLDKTNFIPLGIALGSLLLVAMVGLAIWKIKR